MNATQYNSKARVERARQRWNAGDLEGYLTLYADDILLHGYSPQALRKSDVVGFYRQIWDAFGAPPPLDFFETVCEGDLYACRFVMRGVHRGAFNGVPPSGREIALAGMTMLRFRGDQVVERWSSADFLGLMMQIGALPAAA